MFDPQQQPAFVTRLNRIEGQVRGIRRMIQESRPCMDVLEQLAAAEAALNRISILIVKHHVHKCVPEAMERGEPDRGRSLAELVDIVDRFGR